MSKCRTTILIRRRIAEIAIAAVLIASDSSKALGNFSDNFNGGTDSGWMHYDPNASAGYGAPASFSFPVVGSGDDGYRIAAGVSYAPGVSPARAGSLRTDQSFTQFAESTDLLGWNASATSDQALGLLARLSNIGFGTTDGYAFSYSTGAHEIDLSLLVNESAFNLGKAQIRLTEGHPYQLIFTGVGSTLTGQVYDVADPNAPVLLKTLSVSDSTYAGGDGGLIVFDNTSLNGAYADGTFDNYFAGVTLPEPSSLLFIAIGSVALCRRPR